MYSVVRSSYICVCVCVCAYVRVCAVYVWIESVHVYQMCDVICLQCPADRFRQDGADCANGQVSCFK